MTHNTTRPAFTETDMMMIRAGWLSTPSDLAKDVTRARQNEQHLRSVLGALLPKLRSAAAMVLSYRPRTGGDQKAVISGV